MNPKAIDILDKKSYEIIKEKLEKALDKLRQIKGMRFYKDRHDGEIYKIISLRERFGEVPCDLFDTTTPEWMAENEKLIKELGIKPPLPRVKYYRR